MFTGIIEAVGRIARMDDIGGDVRLTVETGALAMSDVQLGDSIAVNGVCLTAIRFDATSFVADVSNETVSLTTLKQLRQGDEVNLEKALLPTTRLGGHLVSGHVDGVGEVVDVQPEARSIRLSIRAPQNLQRYIAVKGSVCVDGISLTVNQIEGAVFSLNIVPHTQQQTIIKHYHAGRQVNLEVDLIARYLERLLHHETAVENTSGLTMTQLADAGFLK